jgi:heme-degrading monooxygenase HmoA
MATLRGSRIRHIVVFTLRHDESSPEAEAFLAALSSLAAIEGVEELEVVRQVGLKNSYQLAVTMEFASRAAYDAYNTHPYHVAFVHDRWEADVIDFMEIDFAGMGPAGSGEE